MRTIKLEETNCATENLFIWIREYIASKIYALSPVANKKDTFDLKKDEVYNLIINSANINELNTNARLAIKYGLNGLRVYISPLVRFYEYINDKKIDSIKSINSETIDEYFKSEFEYLKEDTRKTYFVQMRSLFKFINENSKDVFKFSIDTTSNGTKIKIPKVKTVSKIKYLEPKKFEKFIFSIESINSKKDIIFNQKLLIKFLCFGSLKTSELINIKKDDCNIILVGKRKFLQISISSQNSTKRNVFIDYSIIEDDYEKSLKQNIKIDYLFHDSNFQQYKESLIYALVEKFYKNAKINSYALGVQAFKYSYAFYLHSKGISLDVVIATLGEVDLEIYNLFIQNDRKNLTKLPIFSMKHI